MGRSSPYRSSRTVIRIQADVTLLENCRVPGGPSSTDRVAEGGPWSNGFVAGIRLPVRAVLQRQGSRMIVGNTKHRPRRNLLPFRFNCQSVLCGRWQLCASEEVERCLI